MPRISFDPDTSDIRHIFFFLVHQATSTPDRKPKKCPDQLIPGVYIKSVKRAPPYNRKTANDRIKAFHSLRKIPRHIRKPIKPKMIPLAPI